MKRFRPCFLLMALIALAPNLGALAQPSTNVTRATGAVILANPVLQEHVNRFLEIINGAEPYNETEYADRFTTFFIDQASLEKALVPIIESLQQTAEDWIITGIIDDSSTLPNAAAFLIASEARGEPQVAIQISVNPSDGNRVDGFLVDTSDAKELENPPETVQDAVDQLEAMGHNFNYIVADAGSVEDGSQCNVIAGTRVEDPAPLGSMFKFWVLGAVLDAISDMTVTWDQLVFITDEARSLPSGIVQNDLPGSNRTVRELAELMISISDNTATDLLLGLVGRTAVEEAQGGYGHQNPSLNMPFLATKELFILKLDRAEGDGQPGPLGKKYVAGDVSARRNILSELSTGSENSTIASFDLNVGGGWAGGPIAIEELEWFGSPLDLCNVMVRLYEDEEAARILSINPGAPDEQGLWSYVGFKGGSEPGVLGLAWYLIPAGDNIGHRVVTGTLWDPVSAIEETKAVLLLGALRDLSFEDISGMSESPTNESPHMGPEDSDVPPGSGSSVFFWFLRRLSARSLLLVLSLFALFLE